MILSKPCWRCLGQGAPRTRDSIPFLLLDRDTLGPPQGLGTSVSLNPLSAPFWRVWVLTICADVVQILPLTDAVPDHRTENGLAHSCCSSPVAPREAHTLPRSLTALSLMTSVSFASLCDSPQCRTPSKRQTREQSPGSWTLEQCADPSTERDPSKSLSQGVGHRD